MADPSLELQGAITARLKSVSGVTNIAGQRVYDRVPGEATFPYISFGAEDMISDNAECITAFEHSIQIDCWSRKPGFTEAKNLANEVRLALHEYEFNLSSNALVLFEHRVTRVFRDPDGLTSHAAVTFTAITEQP